MIHLSWIALPVCRPSEREANPVRLQLAQRLGEPRPVRCPLAASKLRHGRVGMLGWVRRELSGSQTYAGLRRW